MIVPDDLALFLAVVLADHAVPSKRNPLHKAVPGFRDIGRRVDGPSELLITDELEEEEGPNYAPQFTEGDIEFVLAAVGAELPQDRRRTNHALANGDSHPQHIGPR